MKKHSPVGNPMDSFRDVNPGELPGIAVTAENPGGLAQGHYPEINEKSPQAAF
ncbi:MAG: hypothetical protein ACI4TJ_01735 [Candidatus Cryptobacteroides sp.]